MLMRDRVPPFDDKWPTGILLGWCEAMMEFLLGACHDHAK
jgi:hypothetical protein